MYTTKLVSTWHLDIVYYPSCRLQSRCFAMPLYKILYGQWPPLYHLVNYTTTKMPKGWNIDKLIIWYRLSLIQFNNIKHILILITFSGFDSSATPDMGYFVQLPYSRHNVSLQIYSEKRCYKTSVYWSFSYCYEHCGC